MGINCLLMANVNALCSRYELMLRCWNEDPGSRPTFAEIYAELHSLLDEQGQEDEDDEDQRDHDYVNLYQNVDAHLGDDGPEDDVKVVIDEIDNRQSHELPANPSAVVRFSSCQTDL